MIVERFSRGGEYQLSKFTDIVFVDPDGSGEIVLFVPLTENLSKQIDFFRSDLNDWMECRIITQGPTKSPYKANATPKSRCGVSTH